MDGSTENKSEKETVSVDPIAAPPATEVLNFTKRNEFEQIVTAPEPTGYVNDRVVKGTILHTKINLDDTTGKLWRDMPDRQLKNILDRWIPMLASGTAIPTEEYLTYTKHLAKKQKIKFLKTLKTAFRYAYKPKWMPGFVFEALCWIRYWFDKTFKQIVLDFPLVTEGHSELDNHDEIRKLWEQKRKSAKANFDAIAKLLIRGGEKE